MTTIRSTVVLFLLLTFVTGGVYPVVVTAIAQVFFPHAAHGSVVNRDGRNVGSELIGQNFASPAYFWSRPSATSPHSYNAAASSGSNLGPTNPALLEAVQQRVSTLQLLDEATTPPPVDLVTTSASGLDPHISPAAAEYQIQRVAAARRMSADALRQLVATHTETRWLGLLGEPRVNVLLLNIALDDRLGHSAAGSSQRNNP